MCQYYISKIILIDTKFSKIVVDVDDSKESIEAANYAIGLAALLNFPHFMDGLQ